MVQISSESGRPCPGPTVQYSACDYPCENFVWSVGPWSQCTRHQDTCGPGTRQRPVRYTTKPNQTKPNQTKPNQTKPNQTKSNQTEPNQFPNQTTNLTKQIYQTKPTKPCTLSKQNHVQNSNHTVYTSQTIPCR